MKIKHALVISMLAFGSTALMADEDHGHDAKTSTANPCAGMMKDKPAGMGGMMQNKKGGMGMMKPEHMQQMMAMKKAHMQKMEQHMVKMEAMMQELIDLQKAKNN